MNNKSKKYNVHQTLTIILNENKGNKYKLSIFQYLWLLPPPSKHLRHNIQTRFQREKKFLFWIFGCFSKRQLKFFLMCWLRRVPFLFLKFTSFLKLIHIFLWCVDLESKNSPSPSPLFDGWAYISFPPAFVFFGKISFSLDHFWICFRSQNSHCLYFQTMRKWKIKWAFH